MISWIWNERCPAPPLRGGRKRRAKGRSDQDRRRSWPRGGNPGCGAKSEGFRRRQNIDRTLRIGDPLHRRRRDERSAAGEMTAGALIPAGRGGRAVLAISAVMRAQDDLGAQTESRLHAGGGRGDRVVDATKVEGRKQKRQQSGESGPAAGSAPQRLRQSAKRRQGRVDPPGAMHSAHTQSSRSKLVNNLDELSGYDWVRAARKTKPSRAALFSAAPRHRARFRGAS